MRTPFASGQQAARTINSSAGTAAACTRLTMRKKCFAIDPLVAVWTLFCFCSVAPAQDMIAAGEQLYDEHCASCHGEKLRSTGAIPDLKEQHADGRSRFDQMVMNGRGQMPAWQGIVSQDELDELWAYIRSRARE